MFQVSLAFDIVSLHYTHWKKSTYKTCSLGVSSHLIIPTQNVVVTSSILCLAFICCLSGRPLECICRIQPKTNHFLPHTIIYSLLNHHTLCLRLWSFLSGPTFTSFSLSSSLFFIWGYFKIVVPSLPKTCLFWFSQIWKTVMCLIGWNDLCLLLLLLHGCSFCGRCTLLPFHRIFHYTPLGFSVDPLPSSSNELPSEHKLSFKPIINRNYLDMLSAHCLRVSSNVWQHTIIYYFWQF